MTQRQPAQSLVVIALLLPVLLAVVLGLIEVGYRTLQRQELEDALRAATRSTARQLLTDMTFRTAALPTDSAVLGAQQIALGRTTLLGQTTAFGAPTSTPAPEASPTPDQRTLPTGGSGAIHLDEAQVARATATLAQLLSGIPGLADPRAVAATAQWTVLPNGGTCLAVPIGHSTGLTFTGPALCAEVAPTMSPLLFDALPWTLSIVAGATMDTQP